MLPYGLNQKVEFKKGFGPILGEIDIDEFVSNPINTFTMIKRLTLYWPSVRDHLFNQTLIDQWDDFLEEVQSFNELLLADQKL